MPMYTPGQWAARHDPTMSVVVAFDEDLGREVQVAELTGPDRFRNARAVAAIPELLDLVQDLAVRSPEYRERACSILETILHKETDHGTRITATHSDI